MNPAVQHNPAVAQRLVSNPAPSDTSPVENEIDFCRILSCARKSHVAYKPSVCPTKVIKAACKTARPSKGRGAPVAYSKNVACGKIIRIGTRSAPSSNQFSATSAQSAAKDLNHLHPERLCRGDGSSVASALSVLRSAAGVLSIPRRKVPPARSVTNQIHLLMESILKKKARRQTAHATHSRLTHKGGLACFTDHRLGICFPCPPCELFPAIHPKPNVHAAVSSAALLRRRITPQGMRMLT